MKNKLRNLREKNKLTRAQLSQSINSGVSTITKIELGERPLTIVMAARIAPHFGCSILELEPEEMMRVLDHGMKRADKKTQGNVFRTIRIIAYVGAGDWRDTIEIPYDDQIVITVNIQEKYKDADIFCLEVIGNSMDKEYPPGYIIQCIKFDPNTDDYPIGKHVVVIRCDATTSKYEAAIKRLVLRGSQMWLEPESNNSNYSAIQLKNKNETSLGTDNAYIFGIVIGAHRENE